jgi:hypothetical protein
MSRRSNPIRAAFLLAPLAAAAWALIGAACSITIIISRSL